MDGAGRDPDGALRLAEVLERLCDDRDLVREMAELYLGTKDSMLAEIADSAVAGDRGDLCNRIHSLKGVALNFGSAELGAVAAKAEKAAAEGRLDAVAGLMPDMAQEAEALAEALRRFLDGRRISKK